MVKVNNVNFDNTNYMQIINHGTYSYVCINTNRN